MVSFIDDLLKLSIEPEFSYVRVSLPLDSAINNLNPTGTLIHGKKDRDDPTVIYTEAYVNRQTGIIRAVLSACTRYTVYGYYCLPYSTGFHDTLH